MEPRPGAQALAEFLRYLIALAISFLIGGLLLQVAGVSPLRAYSLLLAGAAGSSLSIAESLVKATPLICTGLSFVLALRAGLVNIGAEGQFLAGGALATVAGIYLYGLPPALHVPLVMAAGASAGGLWGGIAGFLKVRLRMNEVITTVMLNYIALYLVSYLVTGPMKETPGTLPQTPPLAPSAQLPVLWAGTRLHLGFAIAVLLALVGHVVLYHTVTGYRVRAAGLNRRAAQLCGVPVSGVTALAMCLSGAVAGVGGAIEIAGVQMRMLANFSAGYGYEGIAVGVLGLNQPIGVIGAGLLIGALRSGANMMQLTTRVPAQMLYVIEGTIITLMLCLRFWLSPRRYGPASRRNVPAPLPRAEESAAEVGS